MKKLSLLGATLALSLLLMVGCGGAKEEGNHGHEHATHESAEEGMSQAAEISFKNEKAEQVFQHYIQVKTALVQGDAAEASKGAEMILASVGSDFNGKEAATTIKEASDLEKQREAFAALSSAVEKSIEGELASGAVYKQYCPMAFNNKGGYWLSDQEAIRNPYFGDKMLKCGRVDKVMGEL
ncbi:DUF3347 domain-containing protein [Echinicola sediminis]